MLLRQLGTDSLAPMLRSLFVAKMKNWSVSDFSFYSFRRFFVIFPLILLTLNSIGVANEINQKIKYTFHERKYISSTERQFQLQQAQPEMPYIMCVRL